MLFPSSYAQSTIPRGRWVGVLAALAFLASCSTSESVPLFDGLGDYRRDVTVGSTEAGAYFDQGLRLLYGFNHAEAIRSFEEAARLDPDCALCYWGAALAYGPNINAAATPEGEVAAFSAITRALDLMENVSEVERGLIEALALRYGSEPGVERAERDAAYAAAMADVARRFPQDPDVAVLHASALMNTSPWDYWTEDKTPRAITVTLLAELERAMSGFPDHAGACHYYIHAVEAAQPARAIPCADRLPALMPEAGHIVHMPTHIYIRVGRWADAVKGNHQATGADERYIHAEGPRSDYTLAYYPHNYDMLSFAASMAGWSAEALEGARNAAAAVDQSMMREPGLGALQHYLVAPLRTMVRFGMWSEILAEPSPPEDLAYPMGTWHFARGMAFAAMGQAGLAQEALASLQSSRGEIGDLTVWEFNPVKELLWMAEGMLQSKIALMARDLEAASSYLRVAMAIEADLTYTEPPDWPMPLAPYLGVVLLEGGRAVEAELVFRDDLAQWSQNGFALRGLADALRAQGKDDEADAVEAQLAEAWADADVTLSSAVY